MGSRFHPYLPGWFDQGLTAGQFKVPGGRHIVLNQFPRLMKESRLLARAQVDADSLTNYWPMAGGSPSGSFAMNQDLLSSPKTYATDLPEDQYYNWPNPVLDGSTTIRYFLGREPERVTLNIYDLSGERIATLDGTTLGETDNEVTWDCSGVTPGVYRCVIEVDFNGDRINAFTDIAVIR